jgi:hypothetical protein
LVASVGGVESAEELAGGVRLEGGVAGPGQSLGTRAPGTGDGSVGCQLGGGLPRAGVEEDDGKAAGGGLVGEGLEAASAGGVLAGDEEVHRRGRAAVFARVAGVVEGGVLEQVERVVAVPGEGAAWQGWLNGQAEPGGDLGGQDEGGVRRGGAEALGGGEDGDGQGAGGRLGAGSGESDSAGNGEEVEGDLVSVALSDRDRCWGLGPDWCGGS